MKELTIHKIEYPADPERCQYISPSGQCNNKRIEGSTNCANHSAYITHANRKKYKIALWQDQIDEKAGNPEIKNLRQEIGILQMLLEKTMNSCSSDAELLIHAPKINNLVLNIDKLIQSCHNLDLKMGMLIDKNTIVQLANVVAEIISEYVQDSDQREEIAGKILSAISSTVINPTGVK